jgi:hypothetical protein
LEKLIEEKTGLYAELIDLRYVVATREMEGEH